MSSLPRLLPALIFLSGAGHAAWAGAESDAPRPRPAIEALAIDTAITVDGVLDEPAWREAPKGGGFLQRQPVEFAPASEPTEIQVAYTPKTLYVAVRAHDSEPERIVAGEMGLDRGLFRDDAIVLLFDTFHDRRNAYFIETNANSSRTDGLVTDEGRDFNVDWDTIWDVACKVDEGGWTAEFAIPFSSLRFDPRLDTWGFQVERSIKRKEEVTFWSPIGLDASLFRISQAGELRGLRDLDVGRNLRTTPFVTGSTSRRNDAAVSSSDDEFDGGLDVKWGVTDGLTLDLTVNTDFAETEVDEIQTNLTRFPLFFPEKRAFFLENSGIFQFGSELGPPVVPFFSRRIGIARDGRMVDLDYGARLAGRAGPWNLGLLGARTGSLTADPENGFDAVPENLWGVARLKRNVGERSFLGLIATHRDGDDGGSESVFGVDGNWKPTDRLDLFGYALTTTGESADGTEVDDADVWGGSVEYTADELSAYASVTEAGENWNPDLGFSFRNGFRNLEAEVTWRPRPDSEERARRIRNWLYQATVEYFENLEGRKESVFAEVNVLGYQFQSGDFLTLFPQHQFERLDEPFEISAGVVIPPGEYEWSRVGFVVRSSTSRPVYVDYFINGGDFFDGDRFRTRLLLGWRPGKRFRSTSTWDHNRVDLPGGSFEANVLRQRMELSFSPDLVINALIQASDASESLGLNLRLNWHYKPGSDLFVVYNHGWDLPDLDRFDDLASRSRQLVVKWTWAWQS